MLLLVAALAVAVGPVDGPERTDAEPSVVLVRDGDLVVFDAKGTMSSADAAMHRGYAIYADAALLDHYTVRLVESRWIEEARPHVEDAVADLRISTGQALEVRDGVGEDRGPRTGEIDVVVSTRSPCGGFWLGCATPVVEEGRIITARIWLNPRLLHKSTQVIGNTVRHEFGHALGLGHFDGLHEDEIQVMHSTSFDATEYRAGDVAGIRSLMGAQPHQVETASAGTPPVVPSSSTTTSTTTTTTPSAVPESTAPLAPATGDPDGTVDEVRATDLGIVVRGEARDPDTTRPISVIISLDGEGFEMTAGRQDQQGSHGFEVVWPADPGEHEVCVRARNVGAGEDTDLGCERVTVSSAGLAQVGIRGW